MSKYLKTAGTPGSTLQVFRQSDKTTRSLSVQHVTTVVPKGGHATTVVKLTVASRDDAEVPNCADSCPVFLPAVVKLSVSAPEGYDWTQLMAAITAGLKAVGQDPATSIFFKNVDEITVTI